MGREHTRRPCDAIGNFVLGLSKLFGDTAFDPNELVPAPLARRIDEGWDNYRHLRGVWPGLCARLGPVAVNNANMPELGCVAC